MKKLAVISYKHGGIEVEHYLELMTVGETLKLLRDALGVSGGFVEHSQNNQWIALSSQTLLRNNQRYRFVYFSQSK